MVTCLVIVWYKAGSTLTGLVVTQCHALLCYCLSPYKVKTCVYNSFTYFINHNKELVPHIEFIGLTK